VPREQHPNPVPEAVWQVIEPALIDLQRPRAVELEFGFNRRLDGLVVWVGERGETGSAGWWLSDEVNRPVEWLVSWANWLQEQVFAEATGAWGEARPACPGHRHPPTVVELDEAAWWSARATTSASDALGSSATNELDRPR
jgi:hypothetical protein